MFLFLAVDLIKVYRMFVTEKGNLWFRDPKKSFKLKYLVCILFLFHTGHIYGYPGKYDEVIDTVFNKISGLSNISIILKKYNVSENANLFDQGKNMLLDILLQLQS